MAIEDGLILARCLEKYDPISALKHYEVARLERTSKIVRASAENATRFQDQILGDPEGADRYINTEWAPERVVARYHWLFEYDATATPV